MCILHQDEDSKPTASCHQCCQSCDYEENFDKSRALSSEKFIFKKFNLYSIMYALQANLTKYFLNVEVNIVDCPNLTEEPFNLASEGFGAGCTTIVDLGGPPYLLPLVDRTRVYNLAKIGPQYVGTKNYPDGWYISGAGAGPWPAQGTNSEMIINLKVGANGGIEKNMSRVISTSRCKCDKKVCVKSLTKEARCAMLANFMVTSGKRGKVLEIKCSQRIDPKTNFTTSLRDALRMSFVRDPVGLGGIFFIRNSKTETFVMPDFSTIPLNSDEEVHNWLKFFHMEAPMLFQSVLVSSDPGLDLRPEHSHGWGFNDFKNEGGHYHLDLTPATVEYHGYFAVANQLLRLDRPPTPPKE